MLRKREMPEIGWFGCHARGEARPDSDWAPVVSLSDDVEAALLDPLLAGRCRAEPAYASRSSRPVLPVSPRTGAAQDKRLRTGARRSPTRCPRRGRIRKANFRSGAKAVEAGSVSPACEPQRSEAKRQGAQREQQQGQGVGIHYRRCRRNPLAAQGRAPLMHQQSREMVGVSQGLGASAASGVAERRAEPARRRPGRRSQRR